MLKKKAALHAVSTDGFEITFRGRDDLIYLEHLSEKDHRQITVFAEMLLGRVDRAIAASTGFPKCWDPPNQGTSISDEERKRILKRIMNALDFLGITYQLDGAEFLNERWCPEHYKSRNDSA